LKRSVNTKRGLKAAAKWVIQEAVLDQFSLAREEEQEREKKRKKKKREGEGTDLVRG